MKTILTYSKNEFAALHVNYSYSFSYRRTTPFTILSYSKNASTLFSYRRTPNTILSYSRWGCRTTLLVPNRRSENDSRASPPKRVLLHVVPTCRYA